MLKLISSDLHPFQGSGKDLNLTKQHHTQQKVLRVILELEYNTYCIRIVLE